MTGGGRRPRSASRSSAAARSAACTPRTWRACPASRCGPSTPGPSTWTRSQSRGLRVTGLADFVAPVHARTDGRDLPAVRLRPRRHQGAAHPGGRRGRPGGPGRRLRRQPAERARATRRSSPSSCRASSAGASSRPARSWRPASCGTTRRGTPGSGRSSPGRRRWARSSSWPGCSPRAGCARTRSQDARGPQWTKVIFNSATSPLAALTGLSVGRVCTDAGLRRQVDGLVTEAVAVCERAGIVLARPPRRRGGRGHRGGV